MSRAIIKITAIKPICNRFLSISAISSLASVKTGFSVLPTRVAKSRIQKRAKIENRLDDAIPKVINERIKVFREKFKDVLKYYRNRNALIKINGNQSREAIHKDILKAIKSL